MATRVSVSSQNVELANKVADLVDQVRLHRPLWFQHVKGHSNDVGNGNDCANFLLGKGLRVLALHSGSVGQPHLLHGLKFKIGWLKCVVGVGGILTRRWLGALMTRRGPLTTISGLSLVIPIYNHG